MEEMDAQIRIMQGLVIEFQVLAMRARMLADTQSNVLYALRTQMKARDPDVKASKV